MRSAHCVRTALSKSEIADGVYSRMATLDWKNTERHSRRVSLHRCAWQITESTPRDRRDRCTRLSGNCGLHPWRPADARSDSLCYPKDIPSRCHLPYGFSWWRPGDALTRRKSAAHSHLVQRLRSSIRLGWSGIARPSAIITSRRPVDGRPVWIHAPIRPAVLPLSSSNPAARLFAARMVLETTSCDKTHNRFLVVSTHKY